ncbi:MAG: ABC transporter permease [Proteobacteria bacterium]|nr:ABC transporter permease [Pseudomonadota bacterium]
MTLSELALRNLRRRPLRSALSALGIGLAVASAIALVALSQSITGSVQDSVDERGSDLTIMQHGASDLFGGFLPAELGQRIAKVPGVTGVAAELLMFAPSEHNREILVTGWPGTSFFWRHAPLAAGRLPFPGERRIAVLGDEAAAALGKRVNDRLEILGEQFRVVGITHYVSAINRGLVIVELGDLQDASYRAGQVTLFHVRVARDMSPAQIDSAKHKIEKLGAISVSMTSEMLRDNRYVAMLNAVSLATSAIAIAIGILNILNTMIFTIQERTREIGILAAVGWSERFIASSIVIEGMILCVFGCIIGVVLGFLASFSFAAIPVIGDYLSFKPTLGLIVPTIAATLALCFFGSAYPAWRAIRFTPAEALQRA